MPPGPITIRLSPEAGGHLAGRALLPLWLALASWREAGRENTLPVPSARLRATGAHAGNRGERSRRPRLRDRRQLATGDTLRMPAIRATLAAAASGRLRRVKGKGRASPPLRAPQAPPRLRNLFGALLGPKVRISGKARERQKTTCPVGTAARV